MSSPEPYLIKGSKLFRKIKGKNGVRNQNETQKLLKYEINPQKKK